MKAALDPAPPTEDSATLLGFKRSDLRPFSRAISALGRVDPEW
jgi:hypothetical protein